MTKAPETIWIFPEPNKSDPDRYVDGEIYDVRQNHERENEQVKYRRADLPPKVKALVWKHGVADCGLFKFVISRKYPKSDGKFTLSVWQDGYFKESTHASEKAAICHAEVIFRIFILSCLEE